jgi:hypothetical protein
MYVNQNSFMLYSRLNMLHGNTAKSKNITEINKRQSKSSFSNMTKEVILQKAYFFNYNYILFSVL